MLLFTLHQEIIQTIDEGHSSSSDRVTHTGGAGRKHSCKSYGSGMIGADKDVPAQGDRAAECLCIKYNTQIHRESLTEGQSRN